MAKNTFKSIRHFKKISDEIRGTNSKEWVKGNGKLYLFKQTQIKENGTSTNAHYSECIYSDLAKLLDINCCKVEFVQRNGIKGIIAEYFLAENEELIDFNALIQNIRIDYQEKSLKCKKSHEYYSIQLLLEALKAVIPDHEEYKNLRKTLLEYIIMDSLCDHYDRNASNIALIKNYGLKPNKRYKLAPLYDNGTSLEVSLPIEVAKDYLENKNGIISLDKGIISKIGIGESRGTSYDELLNYIMANYIIDVEDIINKINYILNGNTLNAILKQKKYNGLNKIYKDLIYNKVLFNIEKINKYYNTYYKSKEKTLCFR